MSRKGHLATEYPDTQVVPVWREESGFPRDDFVRFGKRFPSVFIIRICHFRLVFFYDGGLRTIKSLEICEQRQDFFVAEKVFDNTETLFSSLLDMFVSKSHRSMPWEAVRELHRGAFVIDRYCFYSKRLLKRHFFCVTTVTTSERRSDFRNDFLF